MNGVSAFTPSEPAAPIPISGYAEPMADTRNSTAATSKPPFRPRRVASQPASRPPIVHPSSAQDTAQPDSELALVSGKPARGNEIGVDRRHRARNDGGVVTEQKPPKRGDQRKPMDERPIRRRHGVCGR